MKKIIRIKRIRVLLRRFLEHIVLPFLISALMFLFLLWVAIDILGFRFSSGLQMIVILLVVAAIIGGILFEVAKSIVKRILKGFGLVSLGHFFITETHRIENLLH
ncbi:MAG: hypothetical protein NTY80_02700 [candidate division SR1 bacterium]|nr:hypothetical protein [candidate division SR1 bacterium]